jgi:enoyl-CoA hydratase/carnithine racemase
MLITIIRHSELRSEEMKWRYEEETMTESDISIGVEGQVAILTLGRPHCVDIVGKRLVTHMLHDLGRSSTELRAVLLQATDPRAWLVDVRELADMPPSEARSFSHHGHELARAIGGLPVPVSCRFAERFGDSAKPES